MNEAARPWVEFAAEDLRAADVLYAAGMWGPTCFHAQQCAEKLLKAALIVHDRSYPLSHDIAELLALLDQDTVSKLDPIAVEVGALDEFYMPTCYPKAIVGALADRLPEQEDAAEAVDIARQVSEIITGALLQP